MTRPREVNLLLLRSADLPHRPRFARGLPRRHLDQLYAEESPPRHGVRCLKPPHLHGHPAAHRPEGPHSQARNSEGGKTPTRGGSPAVLSPSPVNVAIFLGERCVLLPYGVASFRNNAALAGEKQNKKR